MEHNTSGFTLYKNQPHLCILIAAFNILAVLFTIIYYILGVRCFVFALEKNICLKSTNIFLDTCILKREEAML